MLQQRAHAHRLPSPARSAKTASSISPVRHCFAAAASALCFSCNGLRKMLQHNALSRAARAQQLTCTSSSSSSARQPSRASARALSSNRALAALCFAVAASIHLIAGTAYVAPAAAAAAMREGGHRSSINISSASRGETLTLSVLKPASSCDGSNPRNLKTGGCAGCEQGSRNDLASANAQERAANCTGQLAHLLLLRLPPLPAGAAAALLLPRGALADTTLEPSSALPPPPVPSLSLSGSPAGM